jgi:4-hydroxy-tetrahydrodipicolinate reductase
MNRIPLVVHGAAGRMGQAVIRAALQAQSQCEIVAALVHPECEHLGNQLSSLFGPRAPEIEFAAALDPDASPAVMIDFTGAAGFESGLALARERGIAYLSGSTGISERGMRAARQASERIPVLWASNFSLGVALLRRLAASAAAALDTNWDAEIIEAHHEHKLDAPSGTALALGKAVAEARGMSFDAIARYARHGHTGARQRGEIGFAVIRAADVIGEHTVMFATAGERIELTHRATSRENFARGAVRSALWLSCRRPGWYDIADVIG